MSQATVLDPIRAAIEIFADTRKQIEKISKKRILESRSEERGEIVREEDIKRIESKLGSKLRARSQEAPELIEEIGLVPALSFFYGKKEDDDYRLLLRAILCYLKNINAIAVDDVDSAIDKPDVMLDLLKDLLSKSLALVPLLRPFLVEFKRLCEATWK